MNWTGGRLHRHSTKNIRRNVGRQLNASTQASQALNLTGLRRSTSLTHQPQKEDQHRQAKQPSKPLSLDHIKRQLLQTSDWATVAAARPLEISFTPHEETERFGKRRRLTEDDRRRLNSSATGRHKEFRQYLPSDGGDIGTVDIRINGRRLHSSHTLDDEGVLHKSSQSMLLDQESGLHAHSNTQELLDDEGLLGPSVQALSSIRLSSVTPGPENISSKDCTATLGSTHTLGDELETVHPFPNCDFATNTQEPSIQESLTKRRFTIDDQADQVIAANKGRRNAVFAVPQTPTSNSLGKLYHDSILSPKTLRELGHHYRDSPDITTDTLSPSTQNCGWLPEPCYNIQRRMQQGLPETSNWDQTLHRSRPFHSASTGRLSKHRMSTSPLTIFGQTVTPDDGGRSEDLPRWMRWNKLNRDSSRASMSPSRRNALAELHGTRDGLPFGTPNVKWAFDF